MRDQVLNLLGSGASQEDTRRLVGCSTDYIGELLKDATFIEELRAKRQENREELIQEGYAKLEQTAINAISKEAAAGMLDAPAMCRVLETVAKNRVLYKNPSGHYTNPTVHLSVELKVPQGAQAQGVVIDQTTSQIVAIGDRNMSPMPVSGVQKMFRELESARQAPAERDIIDADIQDTTQDRRTGDETANETRTSARAA